MQRVFVVGVDGKPLMPCRPSRAKELLENGTRRRCLVDAFGFPKAHAKRAKTFQGWRNGDIARAVIPKGKYAGTVIGKVMIRHRPSFRIGKIDVHPKHLTRLHRSDAYEYEGTRLLPGLKAGVPAA